MYNHPIISTNGLISSLIITNCYFNQVFQSSSASLFIVGIVGSITFNNNTFIGISSSILSISKIDLSLGMNSQISNMNISNSSSTAITFGNFINPTSAVQTLFVENITYSNSTIDAVIDLINTQNIISTAAVKVIFNNFQFSGIEFTNKGNILDLKHILSLPIMISNSSFTNLTSSIIYADSSGSGSSGLTTQAKFVNCVFDQINGKFSSLLNTKNKAILEFTNSTFTNIYTYEEGAVLYAGFKNNSVLFTDCIFKNNSAVQGTIFVIESESFIKCTNCTFMDNFGITNTIVMTVLNGYFEFYNSSIYNNYAVSNPVGELLDSANLCIMSNVTIYNNQALTINAINSEFNTKCDILCFVPTNFINYVNNNKNVFSIVINTSLIQLILSSLTIQNSSVISNEEIFFDCFISSLTIKDSQVKNISSSIRASQSNITLANTVVSEIENSSDLGFVFANLNSIIDISSTSFVNSSSCFIIATDSKVKLSAISLSNVTGNSNLIRIQSCSGILISNLSVENCLSSSSTIYLEKSSNVNLSKLSGAQINNLFMTSYKSNITLIDSFWIDSCLQFLEIKSSSIQLLSNSNFTNNGGKTLMDGGAIWITNSIVNIANSYFFNNSAITGGAISFECTSLKNCNLSITHSTFLSNTGVSKGGAIYYSYNRPVINNVTFINNSAEYGANFASYAYQIKFIDSKNDIMQLSDLVSGIEYNKTLQLSLIDFDNQIMNLENVNQIVISSVNITKVAVRGINTALLRNGVASFTNFIAIAEPGSTNVLLKASSNALDIRKINEVYNSSSNNIIISSFRFCKPGEVRLEDKTCAVCSPGTFSLTWNSTVCEQCIENADCRGGNQIYVDPGYWRNSLNTSTIVKCINNEACNGGFVDQELRTVGCAIGYTGILCNDCEIINGTKYDKVSDNKCSKCPSQILNTIRVIGLSLLLFTFILCIISINIKKTKESEISILLRVFTNYLQMTASMMAFSINYPSSILQIFSPFSEIGSTDVFLSFDCFVSDYDIKGPFSSNKIFKIFLTAILPLVLLLVFVIIWVGLRMLWKRLIPDLSRSITISFITIIFLLHPRLVQSSIAMFECVTIDNNDRRVKVDLQESCFSISHIKWIFAIAVPILIVWVFSMPLIAILLLLINYNKSEDNKVKQYFLILYQGLRKEIFYWEFINTSRKSFILIVFTLISSLNVPLKITICCMFLLLSIRIQMLVKPYTRQENNIIEIWSVATGSLTMMAGIIFEQGNQYAIFNTILLLFIICVNIIFLLEWLYRLSVCIQSSYKRFYIITEILKIVTFKNCSVLKQFFQDTQEATEERK